MQSSSMPCILICCNQNGQFERRYAAGGYDSSNFLNSVERYDPSVDKWELVAPMNVKRSRIALVTCNSMLYAIGGIVRNLSFSLSLSLL